MAGSHTSSNAGARRQGAAGDRANKRFPRTDVTKRIDDTRLLPLSALPPALWTIILKNPGRYVTCMQFQPADTLKSRSYIGLILAQFLAAFNDQAIHIVAIFYAGDMLVHYVGSGIDDKA